MDLRDSIAISPPHPFLGERGSMGEGWSSELQASGSVFCYTFRNESMHLIHDHKSNQITVQNPSPPAPLP